MESPLSHFKFSQFQFVLRAEDCINAIATVHHIDVVVTWNLEHMVKLKTRREVKAINILEGYREIEICTPMEVIESD